MNIPIWAFILIIVAVLIGGAIAGFFICRKIVSKQIEENPPITEAMIKAMYSSMGRTASQSQINATMRAIKDAQKKGGKK